MERLIGKKAYKKSGFFSGAIGVIRKSNSGITPYELEVKGIGTVGFLDERDIVITEANDGIK